MMFRVVYWNILIYIYISSLMMEAVRTSETSVDNHFTRQYIPEDNSEKNWNGFSYVSRTNLQLISNNTFKYKMKNEVLQSFMWKLAVQFSITPLRTVEAVRKSSLRTVDIIYSYKCPLQTVKLLDFRCFIFDGERLLQLYGIFTNKRQRKVSS
jgi:hypothetical protein